ncbi:MAG: hypothetical protein COB02_18625 [Candidatus Cloacimonadota bacterium]|nr:MAG: hypothetical protein COB02_18625 [Candidatus Cloacimonadota bacterium]
MEILSKSCKIWKSKGFGRKWGQIVVVSVVLEGVNWRFWGGKTRVLERVLEALEGKSRARRGGQIVFFECFWSVFAKGKMAFLDYLPLLLRFWCKS